MRVLLEGYAAALFATRAEPDEIARLVEINESLRAGYATHDWQRIMRDAQAWGLTLSCRRAFAIVRGDHRQSPPQVRAAPGCQSIR